MKCSGSIQFLWFGLILIAMICERNGAHTCDETEKVREISRDMYAECVNKQWVCYIRLMDTNTKAEVTCKGVDFTSSKRNLQVMIKDRNWPKGVMCVKYDGVYGGKTSTLESAIEAYNSISSQTGVSIKKLSECKPADGICGGCNDYVQFAVKSGCYSQVGRWSQGGPQEISLGSGCLNGPGTAIHELGHAFGLYHEHSHPKRDIIVLKDQLKVPASNYQVQTEAATTAYDKTSIMHYPVASTENRGAGICIPKDKKKKYCGVSESAGQDGCVTPTMNDCDLAAGDGVGQRKGLSSGDKEALAKMYGGSGKFGKTEPDSGSKTGTTEPTSAPTTGTGTTPTTRPLPGTGGTGIRPITRTGGSRTRPTTGTRGTGTRPITGGTGTSPITGTIVTGTRPTTGTGGVRPTNGSETGTRPTRPSGRRRVRRVTMPKSVFLQVLKSNTADRIEHESGRTDGKDIVISWKQPLDKNPKRRSLRAST